MEGPYEIDLLSGKDYPGSWREFLEWFPDESACKRYLERLRWPDGFICPACGHNKTWRTSNHLWKCRECNRRTSVTAGSILDKTRTPLQLWFAAAWYITNQKLGVSALGFQRVLGLGSQQTAWTMLHKFRKAMVRPNRTKLVGEVEVDETYVGGPSKGGKRGRGAEKNSSWLLPSSFMNRKDSAGCATCLMLLQPASFPLFAMLLKLARLSELTDIMPTTLYHRTDISMIDSICRPATARRTYRCPQSTLLRACSSAGFLEHIRAPSMVHICRPILMSIRSVLIDATRVGVVCFSTAYSNRSWSQLRIPIRTSWESNNLQYVFWYS